MAPFEGHCPVLLQEYFAGTGIGVELLLSHGQPLLAFQHKRLRELPVTGGPSSYRESMPLDPELYDYAVRLLRHVGWTGLAMVEFKVGDSGPKLMEINGRIWGSLPLAVASGVDFPAGLVDLYLTPPLDNPPPATGGYKVGIRCRNLELDVMWIVAVLLQKRRYPFLPFPKRREAIGAFLSLFDWRSRFDVLSASDPKPGLWEIPKIVRKLVGKLRQRSS
jgi:predicted ATP-grasp superfamily ATP-dependent carboligase